MSRGAGGRGLRTRLARLEAPLPGGRLPGWARVLVAEVAAETGLDPAAVTREAEAILAQAVAAGVCGWGEELASFLGAEAGLAPAPSLADARRSGGRR